MIMVVSCLRSKVIVHKSCFPNKIVVGFMSGIHESAVHSIQQSLFTIGDNFNRFSCNYVHVGRLLGLKHFHDSQVFLSAGAKRYFSRQNPCPLTCPMPRDLVAKALPPLMRPKWWKSSKFWILGVCGLFTACFVRIERVPFTGRFHIVVSEELVETLAQLYWKAFRGREYFTGKILPQNSIASIRAVSIAEQIVEAMNARLTLDKEFKMNGRTYDGRAMICKNPASLLLNESGKLMATYNVVCRRDENPRKIKTVLSQSQGRRKLAWKPATKHLNRKDWKVHVLDSHVDNAFCFLGQRILVNVGRIRSDEEIAAIIGHEFGHAVARHSAERFVNYIWSVAMLSIIESWMLLFATVLIDRYILRRNEEEADYIGLMLTASAGYDPRITSKLVSNYEADGSLLATHPPGDVRAMLLNETKTMEEALEIYRQAK